MEEARERKLLVRTPLPAASRRRPTSRTPLAGRAQLMRQLTQPPRIPAGTENPTELRNVSIKYTLRSQSTRKRWSMKKAPANRERERDICIIHRNKNR